MNPVLRATIEQLRLLDLEQASRKADGESLKAELLTEWWKVPSFGNLQFDNIPDPNLMEIR